MIDQLNRLLTNLNVSGELLYTLEGQALGAAAELRHVAGQQIRLYGGIDLAPPRERKRIENWLRFASVFESVVQAERHHVEALQARIGYQTELIRRRATSAEIRELMQALDIREGVHLSPAEIEDLPSTALV